MKLSLETYSYLSGEPQLNRRAASRKEIEEVLLRPRMDITLLTRDQFVELSRADLMSRGWDPPPVLRKKKQEVPLMDLIKERVGVQFGLQSSALMTDILRFQSAFDSEAAKIDVGVYIVSTTQLQNQMRKATGRHWGGLTYNEVARKLPSVGRMFKVPLCLFGLNAHDFIYEISTNNIYEMRPSDIKKVVFDYLENKYNKPIEQDFFVTGLTRKTDTELDGIMRLPETDVIFEVAVSNEGVLRSRLLSDTTRSFASTLKDYRRLTGRMATQ